MCVYSICIKHFKDILILSIFCPPLFENAYRPTFGCNFAYKPD